MQMFDCASSGYKSVSESIRTAMEYILVGLFQRDLSMSVLQTAQRFAFDIP